MSLQDEMQAKLQRAWHAPPGQNFFAGASFETMASDASGGHLCVTGRLQQIEEPTVDAGSDAAKKKPPANPPAKPKAAAPSPAASKKKAPAAPPAAASPLIPRGTSGASVLRTGSNLSLGGDAEKSTPALDFDALKSGALARLRAPAKCGRVSFA